MNCLIVAWCRSHIADKDRRTSIETSPKTADCTQEHVLRLQCMNIQKWQCQLENVRRRHWDSELIERAWPSPGDPTSPASQPNPPLTFIDRGAGQPPSHLSTMPRVSPPSHNPLSSIGMTINQTPWHDPSLLSARPDRARPG